MDQDTTYVASDTSKETLAVAISGERPAPGGALFGTISSWPEAVRKLVGKPARQHRQPSFYYEAGPTGYGLYR